MKHLALAVLMVLTFSDTASAIWNLYWKGNDVTASFDLASRAPFRGKPSLWVRWKYVKPEKGIAGTKIQFTADCTARRLYAIYDVPFDTGGNYLESKKYHDSPKQCLLTPGSLNEATFRLMCPRGQ